jgi:hypothetical protein
MKKKIKTRQKLGRVRPTGNPALNLDLHTAPGLESDYHREWMDAVNNTAETIAVEYQLCESPFSMVRG